MANNLPIEELIVLGAVGVGKTTLIRGYTQDTPTVPGLPRNVVGISLVEDGLDMTIRRLNIREIDTGQSYTPLTTMENCRGCIVMCNAGDEASLNYALDLLYKIYEFQLIPSSNLRRILLISNKADMDSPLRSYWTSYSQAVAGRQIQRAQITVALEWTNVDFMDCTATKPVEAQRVFRRLLENTTPA